MAADILIYKATHVPVGDDQKQHLELARDIAATFNTRYDTEFFVTPEPYITGEATRVMSLRDGSEKMSKSAASDMSRINLTDDADLIAKKIRKAKTDPDPLPETVKELEGRPEALNLVTIYAALSESSKQAVLDEFSGKAFSEFKPALSELAVATLEPITSRMNSLLNDKSEIDNILLKGAQRAQEVARPVVSECMDIMGFWRASL
jgi:tryptophanyl-tRNA synthetase